MAIDLKHKGNIELEGGHYTEEGVRLEKRGLGTVSLGNIDGSVALDLSAGNTFTGTLTDSITISFTNVPSDGAGIVLDFTNIEQITWPTGAKARNGVITSAIGNRYKYILTIRSANDYDIDGLIDNFVSV